MKDSNQYPNSIFYGGFSLPTTYSSLDKKLIKLLYGGNGIESGDRKKDIAEKVTVV